MIIQYKISITGNVVLGRNISLNGTVTKSGLPINGNIICSTVDRHLDHYTGSYVVTPTKSTQTLSTYNHVMDGNVTVNPIPDNYGLITWNGDFLKVS